MFETISKVKRSSTKLPMLKLLFEPKTPVQICKSVGVDLTSASRTLKRLMRDKLVICLNPNEANYRFYKTTLLGKKVIKAIEKL